NRQATVQGIIDHNLDVRYYAIQVDAGQTASIQVTSETQPSTFGFGDTLITTPRLDPVINIRDSLGKVIASSPAGGRASGAAVSFIAPTGGTYLIKVSSSYNFSPLFPKLGIAKSADSTGAYKLDILVQPPAPTTLPSLSLEPPG